MSNNTPKGKKKNSFNAYWIYAGIAVLLIGFSLMSKQSASIEISKANFYELAKNGYIEKIDVFKNTETAEVYVSQEHIDEITALDTALYKTLKESTTGMSGRSADLTFVTPPREAFTAEN